MCWRRVWRDTDDVIVAVESEEAFWNGICRSGDWIARALAESLFATNHWAGRVLTTATRRHLTIDDDDDDDVIKQLPTNDRPAAAAADNHHHKGTTTTANVN